MAVNGLPGLILELKKNSFYYIAKKIEFFESPFKIEKPEGKVITEDQLSEKLGNFIKDNNYNKLFNRLHNSRNWIFVISFIATIHGWSQNIKFSGTVTDSLKGKLAFATIIASPLEKGEIKFAITDEMGRFEILLEKENPYKITASLLGFTPFDFTITPQESFKKLSFSKKALKNYPK